MLTFGSLFAGVGGFDLGLERAGLRCLWQVEKNEWCRGKLTKHWPNVTRRFDDVRELPWWLRYSPASLAPVDLICGGFPCQPHSVAGRREGAKDDRHLWPAMFEVVAALRPAWVLGENVPGIVTTVLDDVLSDLEGLGYACRPFIVPACAVDAPHRRDRVWIVGHTGRFGRHAGGGHHAEHDWSVSCSTGEHAEPLANTQRERSFPAAQPGIYRSQEGAGPRDVQPDRCGCARVGALSGRERLEKWEGIRPAGPGTLAAITAPCRWPAEPGVGRVAHGVPARVDRVSGLGNAVVPQLVEEIGRMIVAAHYSAEVS